MIPWVLCLGEVLVGQLASCSQISPLIIEMSEVQYNLFTFQTNDYFKKAAKFLSSQLSSLLSEPIC